MIVPEFADLQKLCADIGCSLEDFQRVMDDRNGERERERERESQGTPWYEHSLMMYKGVGQNNGNTKNLCIIILKLL